MTLDLAFSVKVFAAMFAIMNPIANIPVFLALTEGRTTAEMQRVAATAFIGVTAGCVIAVTAGGAILAAFGLTVNDFRLAGGLLVLLIALSMVHGSASAQHHPKGGEPRGDSYDDDVAVYPLTIPLLVGPGTIATLIVYGHTSIRDGKVASLAIGLVAFLAVLAACLFSAPYLGRFLSPKVTAITERLMGMILAAIAMEMIVQSLQVAFKGMGAAG
jgi:multiple antibiotic resistance protein